MNMSYGPIAAGIISIVAYSLMQLLFKRSGSANKGGADALTLTAWLGLMAPLWLFVLAVGLPSGLLVLDFSGVYLAYVSGWAAFSVATMLMMIYILQRISLTEFTAYRKALVTAGVLLADGVVLHEHFSTASLAAIAFIVACSMGLGAGQFNTSKTKKTLKKQPKNLSVWATFGFMLALAMAMSLQMLVYKQAVLLQPDVLSHVFLAKALAAIISLGLFAVPRVRKAGRPASIKLIFGVIICFFIGSVFEAAAIKHLPLTLVMILSLVAAAAFAAHDVWRKDLPRTWRTGGLIAGIFLGFAALAYVN
jgi:drug/metabolite transporter (DMT)-like permease